MSQHDRDDRQAILSRRAALISAALAGIACTAPREREPQPTKEAELEVAPVSEPAPEVEQAWPSWADVVAKRPALDVPEGLSPHEHEDLRRLVAHYGPQYEGLAGVWERDISCSPGDPACEVWPKTVALMIARADVEFWGFWSNSTSTVAARAEAHEAYVRELHLRFERRLDDETARAGERAQETWQRELRAVREHRAAVAPCLSISGPPAGTSSKSRVPFGVDDARMRLEAADKARLLDELRGYPGERSRRIIVRGHADPGERDPEGLARKRAEAVRAWLVDAGIPADGIELRTLGSRLLVLPGPSAANRRVDFELDPPRTGMDDEHVWGGLEQLPDPT